ncbi:hypothetical protein B0T26DRAFT_744454 [Lasiosphaeria miniovina]|uniref:HNH nuclease domain-containing protein n=1 Tax=Lasiosphaeria miniovina TaxID=1954250 RepID=A0AA40DHI3_9PEZI|nr:uncharacterized protein B0T26DRAFT_744454 [Lasiosphaeria miniovina]KAK0703759.1 hypothetical protein B0T26DRAFT_744454 [Lasiosphaeria miniovina]
MPQIWKKEESARPRPPDPAVGLPSEEHIRFRHPGYDSLDLLLTLPRVDSTRSISTYGVHHRTALLACQIIAGNAFANSYFSLDKAGQQQVQVSLDGILTDTDYYFIVEGSVLYPIVPSFQDWEFPHNRIPDWWPSINASSVTTTNCGITNAKEHCWYQDNQMHMFGGGDINNQGNLLPLRKDIHHSFNARWFVIVPRIVTIDSSLQPSLQYVTHIISDFAAELWASSHITLVGSLKNQSRAYLFARFAWAMIFRTKLFVIAGQRRHVIRVSRDTDGKVEYKTMSRTGEEPQNAYGGRRSKTATPRSQKKRKSGQISPKNEDSFTESSRDSDTDMDDMDWRGWGRNRRQESSEETAPDIMEETAPNTKVHLEPAVEMELRTALRQVIPQQGVASED